MSEARGSRSFRTYLAEGVTIMVGILAALFMDAAWDYRNDRADEREYMAGLRAEFESASLELASDQERRQDMATNINRLLEAHRSNSALDPLEIRDGISSLLNYRFYTPSHPVMEDILSAGRLHVLRSDSLRFALRRYTQERDRLAVAEQRDIDLAANQVSDFLAQNVALPRLFKEEEQGPGTSLPGQIASEDEISLEDRVALASLLRSDEFGSVVYLRLTELETVISFAIGLDFTIQAVLGQLQ